MLLQACSRAGAERHWQRMRARSETEAQGALAWLLRRRWGLAAAREAARLILDRLQFVGPGAGAADLRRTCGRVAAERRCQARRDALEFASLGHIVREACPAFATHWA